MLLRYINDGNHISACLFIDRNHLFQTGFIGHHQIISKQYREGLVSHQHSGAPDGVAKAQGMLLAGVGNASRFQHRDINGMQFRILAAFSKNLAQFKTVIEEILDRRLTAPGHKDNFLYPRCERLIDRMMNKRLINYR